ncbi:MAG: protein-export chaperone SecB [Gammaproteobacteria bacterium]
MTEDNTAAGNTENQPQFAMHRIYLKDVSFETPNTPQIFKEQWQPEINMQLNSAVNPLEENNFEVVLTITVTAKKGDLTGFLVEVQQAGIFHLSGYTQEQTSEMLGAYCPNTLYPFAREAISDLVNKGGFPQLLLAPVNFDAIYAQRMLEAQQQASETTSKH